jgi:hypothetical protein
MSVGRAPSLLTQPARPRPPIPEDAVIIDLCSSESEDDTPAAVPRTDLRVEDSCPPSSTASSDDVAQGEMEGNVDCI